MERQRENCLTDETKKLKEENSRLLRALVIVANANASWYSLPELQKFAGDTVKGVTTA